MPRQAPPVVLSNPSGGGISTISSIEQLPGEMVQVSYNRVVPEMAQGSLDNPQIRQLLMMGMRAGIDNGVRADSVALISDECRIGHSCRCRIGRHGHPRRAARQPAHRPQPGRAAEGTRRALQPYVAQDEAVRDAVAQALLVDSSSAVRTRAVSLLQPVRSDSSVRQVLRHVLVHRRQSLHPHRQLRDAAAQRFRSVTDWLWRTFR